MNLKRAGVRAAALSLLPLLLLSMRVGSAASSAPSVTSSPAASAAPAPAPVAVGSLKATRVACTEAECTVATWLFGPAVDDPDIRLLIRNDGSAQAVLGPASVRAVGDRSGVVLNEAQVAPQSAAPIEADGLGEMRFRVTGLAPDHYTGELIVAAPGAEKPVSADIDVTIRQGPVVPIILLAIGGLLAVVLRIVRQQWLPAGDVAARISMIDRRLRVLQLGADEQAALGSWQRTAKMLVRARDLGGATTIIDATEEAIGLFELLVALLISVGNRTDAEAQKARELIAAGRAALVKGEKGLPGIEAARQAYNEATVAAMRDPGRPDLSVAALGIPELRPPTLLPPAQVVPEPISAGRLLWLVVRANLVRGLLAILALAVGLYTLYVAPSAGYIGGSFADSAALLLWGLGSGWVDKVVFDWG